MLDPNLAVAAVQVLRPQMTRFVEPQPRAVHGGQKGAVFERHATHGEQAFDLRLRVSLGSALGFVHARHGPFDVVELALEHEAIEEAQAAHRHVERARGLAALGVQPQQVSARLLVLKLVGSAPVVRGQPGHGMNVGFFGFVGVAAQD